MKRYCPSLISLAVILLVVQLNGCSSTPSRSKPMASAPGSGGYVMKPYPRKGGGFYKDDGLPAQIPENIDQIPNATPRLEPLRNAANKPYTVLGMSFTPMTRLQPFSQQGIGSWYGTKFNGLKTSNGDTYDMFAMTAAHPTLPLPCYVRVTNTQNNRSVIVRVNDRGPFVEQRIIDLTHTGATNLGMMGPGTARVRVESVGAVAGLSQGGDMKGTFYVQVGAFGQRENAKRLSERIKSTGKGSRYYYADMVSFWRVQVGPYSSLQQAESARTSLLGTYPNCFVVAE